ncbi:MAG TPA: dihydrofolate reductase family protein [Propionicimonas sp.]|nr:dihydrofolate reductase family protein [Propionicimonas sp.]
MRWRARCARPRCCAGLADWGRADFRREYGEVWTAAPKILVSRTRTRTRTSAEHNTRIIGDDAINQLAELPAGTDGDIGVGGATIATQLLRAHLLDELLLFTHPVALGEGRPLFDELDEPVVCDLVEQRSFDWGVTMHRYSVRGAAGHEGVTPASDASVATPPDC